MVSIVSTVSRIPAVSIKRNETPSILITSSITSRVVPAISETIAFSSFSILFNNVDLPTLVCPTIATGTPFLITLPKSNDFKSFCIKF